jgi:hypothetical protein
MRPEAGKNLFGGSMRQSFVRAAAAAVIAASALGAAHAATATVLGPTDSSGSVGVTDGEKSAGGGYVNAPVTYFVSGDSAKYNSASFSTTFTPILSISSAANAAPGNWSSSSQGSVSYQFSVDSNQWWDNELVPISISYQVYTSVSGLRASAVADIHSDPYILGFSVTACSSIGVSACGEWGAVPGHVTDTWFGYAPANTPIWMVEDVAVTANYYEALYFTSPYGYGNAYAYADPHITVLDPNFWLNETIGNDLPGVPEPATWAMLILGVAMIGFAARRRRDGVAVAV